MIFSNYTMQSICFCNLLREVGCSLACVGVNDMCNCDVSRHYEKKMTLQTSEFLPCHCEELCDEAIQSSHEQSTPYRVEQNTCHCEECNDEAIQSNYKQSAPCRVEQNTCHCEELCDEAIQTIQTNQSIQKEQESRGVKCQ